MGALALFGAIVFGAIGSGYIWSGRRRGTPVVLISGIGLAVVSYLLFVHPAFFALGVVFTVLPFFIKK